MANSYDLGDLVRVTAVFTNSSGTAIDPTVVICKYKDPSGNTTTLTYGTDVALVKDSVGNYHTDINCDEAGDWLYRWYSTGTGQAAEQHWFRVEAAKVT